MTQNQHIPLYGTIPFYGGQYSVTFTAVKNGDGCYTTSVLSGYGEFPFSEYPGMPVIDYRDNEAVWEALKIRDNNRPAESNPHVYRGTLKEFLTLHVNLGIKVHNFD